VSDVQQGPSWWQASDGRWYPPEQQPAPPAPKKSGGNFIASVIVLGLIVALVVTCTSLTSSDETDSAPPSSFTATVADIRVVNPATVTVIAEITNTGDTAAVPECRIDVADPSGTYDGWDTFTARAPVEPGATDQMVARLTVTNEGAAWVTESEIDCS